MIPEQVLYMELETIDGDKPTLKELIRSTTPETIVNANFIVGADYDGNPSLSSFTGWTETKVLTLINTAYGVIMVCNERNYK